MTFFITQGLLSFNKSQTVVTDNLDQDVLKNALKGSVSVFLWILIIPKLKNATYNMDVGEEGVNE